MTDNIDPTIARALAPFAPRLDVTAATRLRIKAEQDLATFESQSKVRLDGLKAELRIAREQETMALGGLDLNRILHAEHVLRIYGRLGGESASAIEDARKAILAGGGRLRTEFFGTKNYDRWSGQRCDCSYGYGPSHGYIVFEIGLTSEARKRDLTAEEIEDALYLLGNVKAYLDAKVKA